MIRFRPVLLFVLLFSNPASAFDVSGLQPLAPNGVLSTFSAESLQKRKFSAEFQMERSREPDFYRVQLRGAYGITDALELSFNAPYVFNYDSSVGERDGMEDIALGLKHRFLNEGRYRPAIAYILTGSLPSGRDLLSTDGRVGAGIVVSKKLGPFDANFNALYLWPFQERLDEEVLLAAGLRLHATHSTWILVEALVRQQHGADSFNQAEVRLGYRIKAGDRVYTTIGAGADFRSRHPEYRMLFSLNFTSPSSTKKLRQVYEEE
ncbi:MAG: hypothetical protein OHK006_00600 [Thermodesulfovibrionales bacterium]